MLNTSGIKVFKRGRDERHALSLPSAEGGVNKLMFFFVFP